MKYEVVFVPENAIRIEIDAADPASAYEKAVNLWDSIDFKGFEILTSNGDDQVFSADEDGDFTVEEDF